MSAAQSLALLRGMLPGMTAAEVSEAFAAQLRPEPGGVHRRAARERRRSDGGRAAGARPRGRRGHAGQGGGGREGDGAPDHAAHGRRRRREPDACRERRDVDVARQWRARPPPVHGRAQERGEHRDHARRRDDPGDGGGPRPHRGGAARLGPPGDERPVEHGDPRPDDGREGAGAQRDDGRHADAHRVGRSRRARAGAPARVPAAHRPGHRAGRARAVEGRGAAAHRRAEESADAGPGHHQRRRRSIPRTRRGPSR